MIFLFLASVPDNDINQTESTDDATRVHSEYVEPLLEKEDITNSLANDINSLVPGPDEKSRNSAVTNTGTDITQSTYNAIR